jgi:hypothetical protein
MNVEFLKDVALTVAQEQHLETVMKMIVKGIKVNLRFPLSVKAHVTSILTNLDAIGPAEAIAIATTRGLIGPTIVLRQCRDLSQFDQTRHSDNFSF